MFNNLIESSSHAKEFKRRGSFLLFTTATYVVLFVVTGVVSIYAYDARLESQLTELEILSFVPPPAPEEPKTPTARDTPRSANLNSNGSKSIRTTLIASTANPHKVPDQPGTKAADVPPATKWSELGSTNSEPIVPPGGTRGGVPGGTGPTTPIIETEPPPSATPTPTPEPVKLIRKSVVLNSEAISLPRPRYPQMAVQIRLQGVVNVQVLIDEQGNVVSAKAVSGHPMLIPEAQRAAQQAKFSPTFISGQRVKVSGVISYNFTMSN